MSRSSRFLQEADAFLNASNSNTQNAGISQDSTTNALLSLQPFHPNSVAEKEKRVAEDNFRDAYERFHQDLVKSLKSYSRPRQHELCTSLRTLERLIHLAGGPRIRYRLLMAVNIFKNFNGTLSKSDIDASKTGLFEGGSAYNEDLLLLIAESVSRIRSTVGMKVLHEAIAFAWKLAMANPTHIEDDLLPGVKQAFKDNAPSDVFESIFKVAALSIGDFCVANGPGPSTSLQYASNEICYAPISIETSPFTTVEIPDAEFNEPMPGTSSQNSGMKVKELLDILYNCFPDNHVLIVQQLHSLLTSDRSNEELQGELIDLLGFDHFETVTKILENRVSLSGQLNAERKQAKYEALSEAAASRPRDNGSIYCQQVIVQSKNQAEARKELRKEQKKAKREWTKIQHAFGDEEKLEMELAHNELMKQRELEISQLKWNPSIVSAQTTVETYPYVFDARIERGLTMLNMNGMKYSLPEGSTRECYRTHESVLVPPTSRQAVDDIKHVYVKDMDEIGQLGFQGFEKLNVIQSLVFEQAYKTKENLLICAPTGAGKTNIAMLTILNVIHEYTKPGGDIAKDDFKIIYIAPMKALATEMTESFGKRLKPLGIKVRELTGDTQLSKKEVAETQMLVVTPEKWDVVTRKGSADTSLTSLVRLLIIDEVHLLHDDRGPVIETIVARTLRQVEMSQFGIRIVGLSATLPNYVDVARFLRVNLYKGLFFFDGRFRPVPLTQKFIGVKKVGDIKEVQRSMDEVCYDEVFDFVKRGHQVLVFVHARNATSKLAQSFRERAAQLGHLDHFISTALGSSGHTACEKAMKQSKNYQMYEFFRFGFGIHHAGLVRSDRLLVEKTFAQGHISVLFCTATLAWGVNLPAHAVVIRGTDVFDAEKGQFSDLGVLDVQQIFGRAGRPQFENEGHGIIITMQNKLSKYLTMLTRQAPIESNFLKRIEDNMNAEISLGTVSTVDEAVEWLTYTYFYTRAIRNPLAYDLKYNELDRDPDLRMYLANKVMQAAERLDRNKMIRYDARNGFLFATDVGRIASNFYVKYETIELFNSEGLPVAFSAFMADDMVIGLIASATEFAQLKVREEECLDLEELVGFGCVMKRRGGGLESIPGKVNVLLQAYISRCFIRSFSLSSESLYVQQNATRLCRAMFEISLKNGWAQATNACLTIARCIENRIWPNQSPLRQVSEFLRADWIDKIERKHLSLLRLLEMPASEIGDLLKCKGEDVYECLRMLPRLEVEATLKPITYTIVQVEAVLTSAFYWNDKFLGKNGAQAFWVFLENINENMIVFRERVIFNKKKVIMNEPQHLVFTIPIRDHQLSNNFQMRIASDYYLTEDTVIPLSMHNCILPPSFKAHTDLLDLEILPVKTLKNSKFESIYKFPFFNLIQTQVFHCLYKTDDNALIGAPTGSGKTCCAELAIFRILQDHPGQKCVYIAPLKALVRERVSDWKDKFERNMGYKVTEVSGDFTPEKSELMDASILITTPEKWDGISRSWATREYVQQVGLIIIDEIHLLGVDRGAVLEAIITRMKLASRMIKAAWKARIIGLSTALANAGDVAEWLGIPSHGLFNFRPSVRPVPINVHIQGFPGQHYCPRMALMNKPAFKAIKTYSPTKPTLVFVASRRQTRLTALAFISHLVAESNAKQWVHMETAELEDILVSVKDENLKLTLPFGIGMHHAGLSPQERSIVEQLFLERKIQVLVATATLAWGINMPAHLVIVKGTEFFDGKLGKYVDFPVTDVLQMMGRAGRPQFDDSAVAVVFVQDAKKNFYKHFLYEPFPVESSLLDVLPNHVNAEINAGLITNRQGIVQYLAGTYFYRRLFVNPNFYGLVFEEDDDKEQVMTTFLSSIVDDCVQKLSMSSCIIVDEDQGIITPSPYGRLAAIYYLRHESMKFLLENMKSNLSIEEALMTLTHIPEYGEVPVRHNEDNHNAELQRRLRIRFSTSVLDSSFTKTHLLMQAHFSRIEMQTDYRTDCRSVLDQSIRILEAMRSICLLRRWFSTTLNLTLLQQMLYCGMWHDDHPLLALPHLSVTDAEVFENRISTIPLLQSELGVHKVQYANEVMGRAQKLFRKSTTLDEGEIKELTRALCTWPILNVSTIKLMHGAQETSIGMMGMKSPLRLNASEMYKIKLVLEMMGPSKFTSTAELPRWSKEKVAGWMIFVGEKESDHLYSSSHISSISDKKTVRIDVRMPENKGRHNLTVIIVSDCYMGIDQEYEIPIELI